MPSQKTTQHTFKSQILSEPSGDPNPEKENKNKSKFIQALKEFIKEKKGKMIFDQIDCQLPSSLFIGGHSSRREFDDELVFDGYKKQGASSAIDLSNGSRNEATVVDLEIDLMEMILHDPFLGENFIKCLFRYYSHLN